MNFSSLRSPTPFCLLAFLSLCLLSGVASLRGETVARDLPYLSTASGVEAYRSERAVLDVYASESATPLPVVIWFHGGGLVEGDKSWIPKNLRGHDLVVVSASYRLIPHASPEQVLQDAAAAVAWTFGNIRNHGGDTRRIFLSGHSAGAYLSTMLVLDSRWLAAEQIDTHAIAGLIPFSGQMAAHGSFRDRVPAAEIERYAPLHHARADAPPVLLLVGDREKDLPGRHDENARMFRRLSELGHARVELVELDGTDHVGMQQPGVEHMLRFISRTPAALPRAPAVNP